MARVAVGCIGGLGRTGTVLACMAILAGIAPAHAVEWVRDNYDPAAVETPEQDGSRLDRRSGTDAPAMIGLPCRRSVAGNRVAVG